MLLIQSFSNSFIRHFALALAIRIYFFSISLSHLRGKEMHVRNHMPRKPKVIKAIVIAPFVRQSFHSFACSEVSSAPWYLGFWNESSRIPFDSVNWCRCHSPALENLKSFEPLLLGTTFLSTKSYEYLTSFYIEPKVSAAHFGFWIRSFGISLGFRLSCRCYTRR